MHNNATPHFTNLILTTFLTNGKIKEKSVSTTGME